MEKCTYCTQRIEAAHVAADKENRPLRDGEVVTACQQACPTKAIVFGNIKDSETRRSRSARRAAAITCCWKSSARGRAPPISRAGTTDRGATAHEPSRAAASDPAADQSYAAMSPSSSPRIPLHFPTRRRWLIALGFCRRCCCLLFVSVDRAVHRAASASGASTSRSTGPSPSTITSGGSASAMPAR